MNIITMKPSIFVVLCAAECPCNSCAVCSWMPMCGVSSHILQPFCWDNGLFQKFSHTVLSDVSYIGLRISSFVSNWENSFTNNRYIMLNVRWPVWAVVQCFGDEVGSKSDTSYRNKNGWAVDQVQHVEERRYVKCECILHTKCTLPTNYTNTTMHNTQQCTYNTEAAMPFWVNDLMITQSAPHSIKEDCQMSGS
jgi:hypothetical protein